MDNDWRRNIPPFPTPETEEETPPTTQPNRFQQATQGAVDWWQRGQDARAQTSFLPRFGGGRTAQDSQRSTSLGGAFALPAAGAGASASAGVTGLSGILSSVPGIGFALGAREFQNPTTSFTQNIQNQVGAVALSTILAATARARNVFGGSSTAANTLTGETQTLPVTIPNTATYYDVLDLPLPGNVWDRDMTNLGEEALAQAESDVRTRAETEAKSATAATTAEVELAKAQAEATTGGKPPDPDGDKKKEDPKDKNKFLDFLKRTYPWLITSGLLAGGLGGVGNEGSQGVGESELSSMLSQRPEGVLGEYLSRSPDEMYEDTLERTMESLRNQQVGLEESYSNLYARALQQSYRRRVATSDPFRGVTSTGGQVEQGREALSAAEINQLGQISMGFNEMLREIQNAELAAPDKALQAALQQYGISREQSEAEFLRVQRITEVLNSDNAEDVIRMNLQALGVEPQGIEELLGIRDKNKGNINWNQIMTTSGIGGIIGLIIGTFVGQPMLGASIGGSVAGAGNYGWQWIQEQDWYQEWLEGLED